VDVAAAYVAGDVDEPGIAASGHHRLGYPTP